MAEYPWCDLFYWQTFATEHHRKQVETDMIEHDWDTAPCLKFRYCYMPQCISKRMREEPTQYEKEFDAAAADTSSPWLPPPPVADAEASETRGVSGTFGSIVDATLGEREKNYGDFSDNARSAQMLKGVLHLSAKWHAAPDYVKEATDLIMSKLARAFSGDPLHIDTWHDIQGYAKLVEQRIIKGARSK
jgi:hypothetical protein